MFLPGKGETILETLLRVLGVIIETTPALFFVKSICISASFSKNGACEVLQINVKLVTIT